MRHGTSSRRQRNRGNGGRRGNQKRQQVFDSNGPDVRIRGTAHQVAEKYDNLAKDAASSGNRVLAESYLQHAEHYVRLIVNDTPDVHSQKGKQNNSKKEADNSDTSEDDLSLPSSILGDSPKTAEKAKMGRTEDMMAG